MRLHRFLYTVALLLCAAGTHAQLRDVTASYYFHPDSKYLPPLDSADQKGSTQHNEFNLNMNMTLRQRIDTTTGKVSMLSASVWGRYSVLRSSGFNKAILPTSLLASNLGLQYYATISQRWSYAAFLSGGLNTGFKEIDFNDIFLSGGVIFIRQFSPKFRLGMGVLVHNTFGTPLVWPAITADWRFGNKFKLDIRVPDEGPGIAYKIGIAYQLNPRWQAEFAFKPHVLTYDVKQTAAIDNRLMSFWQLPFGLNLHTKRGPVEFFGGAGFTALRRFGYGEKKLSKMFAKYPYYGLGANLFVNAGVKVNLQR
ncbi:DUF6268 family outer membrane beta-barrel protein [Chitinophaga horti]|uniref:DUF6268 family outer membrane beta-barrel protein n=1 Tax=Chitinophaga horti TaxID=2920382 RepID=A0ABY6J170_9BACT|nr:DUF6268 family outer membrane beta-barrel protein [Chitinophaga horti]UYQ93408.1 DUF6268 family outer membrane beta-barrel protein [Chitinophaga horti]